MEDLPSAVETQIAASKSRPVRTCQIYLDAGTIRYAAAPSAVVFPTAGNTYTAIHFTGGSKKVDTQNQIVTKKYTFDDRNGVLQGLNAAEPFKGKAFVENKIWLDALGDSTYFRELMAGEMMEPEFDEQVMTVTVIEGKNLDQKANNKVFQKPCGNDFGNANCNYDGNADLTSLTYTGTADSGDVDYLIDSDLTQADDYWNFGPFTVTISGNTYQRKVADFIASSNRINLDVPLPITISNGDSYTVTKGCPKTLGACRGEFAYGPSADNEDNFIGFIHLLFAKGVDK